VWVCIMCGCVYMWMCVICRFVNVYMFFSNMCVCVCVGSLFVVCVCVGFVLFECVCGLCNVCVYMWVL